MEKSEISSTRDTKAFGSVSREQENKFTGTTAVIKHMLYNCSTCVDEGNQQSAEPIIPHEISEIPWTNIGTDIFEFLPKLNGITVDYTTKFFDIHSFTDKQSSPVIMHLKSMYAKFSIPQTVMSDNGLEFKANEFKIYAKEWNFQRDTSNGLYPKPNGLLEYIIQTIKCTLKKAMKSNPDLYQDILTSRTIPFNGGCPHGVIVKAMDCGIVVSEFEI